MSATSGCGCGPCDDQTAPLDAANEPLTSVIDNFVEQFFGTVTKTVVNGEIVWTLPCDLDTGVPANPREEGESLACYFKRLFEDGVVGLTGPAGPAGADGADGINAFTEVTDAFTSPTLSSPDVTFDVADSTGIAIGSIYFVETLGWLQVFATAAQSVSATLLVTVSAPAVSVSAGALVAPAGPRGPAGLNGYTATSANFTAPAIGGSVNIPVLSVTALSAGLWVFVATSGYYEVTSVAASSFVGLYKVAVSVPAAPVVAGASVVPAGKQGETGATGATGATGPAGPAFVGILTPAQGGTGTNNGVNTIAIAGAFATTGAFSTTFAAQGNAVFTLPAVSASLGYLNVPQNSKSADYTTVLSDAGKHLYHPTVDVTGRTFTIDSNANVPYPIGTVLEIVNDLGAGAITLAIASDTLYDFALSATGSRTIAAEGYARVLKVAPTRWVITNSLNVT